MKKTKIVCTMGPNTNDREMMRKLIDVYKRQVYRESNGSFSAST